VSCCLTVMIYVYWSGLACVFRARWRLGLTARCDCAVYSPGRWQHSLVGSARRSWLIAGHAVSTSPLLSYHGDIRCHNDVTPFWIVTDNLTPLVVTDNIPPSVVQQIIPRSNKLVSLSCCVGSGYFFLMSPGWLFFLDIMEWDVSWCIIFLSWVPIEARWSQAKAKC
jgi:hypothetical protein